MSDDLKDANADNVRALLTATTSKLSRKGAKNRKDAKLFLATFAFLCAFA